MNANEFKRILSKFADRPDDVDLSENEVVVQVQNNLLMFSTEQAGGLLYVKEGSSRLTAEEWIAQRLADLPILAARILEFVPTEPAFIPPSCSLIDHLDKSPSEQEQQFPNSLDAVLAELGDRLGLATSVLYLTSDAGEGKTTIINQAARMQAQRYLDRKSDWLVVPIPLGGRHFLRLDDVVAGSIVNRLRFRSLYYDSFLELVKLGFIVPAFDGFEEMFVVGSSGEAVSSLGNLISNLQSSGNLLVAARRAYYEIRDFDAQARLFDSLRDSSASFARIQLKRWQRPEFVHYWEKRGLPDGQAVFERLSEKLGTSHPLITRAVLIKRVADLAEDSQRFEALLRKIGESSSTYFRDLVDSIIEREIESKWFDVSGDSGKPLLGLEGHHELLSILAQEMLNDNTAFVPHDSVELLVDMFCDSKKLSVSVGRQIRSRIFDHPMLAKQDRYTKAYGFDHDEFREFFLGEGIGRLLFHGRETEIRNLLRKAVLSAHCQDAVFSWLLDRDADRAAMVSTLLGIAKTEMPSSYCRDNCGGLIMRLLQGVDFKGGVVSEVTLAPDCFVGGSFKGITFHRCYLQDPQFNDTQLENCSFVKCEFENVILHESARLKGCSLEQPEVHSLLRSNWDVPTYDPNEIISSLVQAGFRIIEKEAAASSVAGVKQDAELTLLTRALRTFERSTGVNDDTFRCRLGKGANSFLESILPDLLGHGIVQEIDYVGSGKHRRFRLAVPMSRIQDALQTAHGKYGVFLDQFQQRQA